MHRDKKTVCKFYLKGYCNFGDRCKNLHPSKKVDICKHYLKCNCKFGDKCINIHSNPFIKCNDFYEGKCPLSQKECPYSHSIDDFKNSITCFKLIHQKGTTEMIISTHNGIQFDGYPGGICGRDYLLNYFRLDRFHNIDYTPLHLRFYGGDFNDVISNLDNLKKAYEIQKDLHRLNINSDIINHIVKYILILTVNLPIYQYTKVIDGYCQDPECF